MKTRLSFQDLFAVVALLGALALAACVAPPGAAPAATSTPAPAPVATVVPTPATAPVSPAPTPGAVMIAQQLLAQQLHMSPADITVVSYEAVDWPDACLGIEIPGRMCAEVITPGFRIVLEAAGRRYEFHTDATGSNVQLAAAPAPDIPDVAIVWTGLDEPCQTVQIGSEAVAFGACGGILMTGPYALGVEDERQAQYRDFVTTYAAFKAETPAGAVDFAGRGSMLPTPAEQRMIAEWARLVSMEATGGRSGASYGLVLAWHREGGLKGFCNDLAVYADGRVYATSCEGSAPVELGRRRLDATEADQLFRWVDALKSFEHVYKDPATVDAMTRRLVFTGNGTAEPGDADLQAMYDFAARIYDDIDAAAK